MRIKHISIFENHFNKIQSGKKKVFLYSANGEYKDYKKGDILRLEKVLVNKKSPFEMTKTTNHFYVEVKKVKVHEDDDKNKIFELSIKPRLDMGVKLNGIIR